MDFTIKDACDNTLSWDGILCKRCRYLYDTYIVHHAHEEGLCRGETRMDEPALPKTQPRYPYRVEVWWHPIASLRKCATRSCKLCELALSKLSDRALEDLESWQATLPAKISVGPERRHSFQVNMPLRDPRPEAEIFDSDADENYACMVISVMIQDNSDQDSLQAHKISSFSTASDETFGQIATWLRSCESHKTCTNGSVLRRQNIDIRPTRLLKLARGKNQPRVRLVHTVQMNIPNVPYATLSHCWGRKLVLRLQKHLIKNYTSDIPWRGLPQTFQDAITTSLKLGIHYLWIDALCIVQDDEQDWIYEAARMVGVYSNSYLNISAEASHDGTEGLFRERDPTELQSFMVPHWKGNLRHCGSVFYTDRWWKSVYGSPLADRAWTIQENFLAPRALHFAEEEVHWECMELYTAESLPTLLNTLPDTYLIIRKSSLRFDESAQEKARILYGIWYQLVATYSEATLSFVSDRAIAIAGLACIFCHLLELPESDYLCGLWRPQLEHDLMWRRDWNWTTSPQDLRIPDLPTWSWLSLCTGVDLNPRGQFGTRNVDNLITAEVIQASTTPRHSAFGPVSSGEVVLKVYLCQATIRKGNHPFYDGHKNNNRIMDISGSILREEEHYDYSLDECSIHPPYRERQILNTPVYLMLGRASRPKGDRTKEELSTKVSLLDGEKYECLLLEESSQLGHFRRLGHICFEPVTYMWNDIPTEQLATLRSHAHGLLRQHFLDGKIPDSVCGRPDHTGRYTITLV